MTARRLMARITAGVALGLSILCWPTLGAARPDKDAADPPIVYAAGTELRALTPAGDPAGDKAGDNVGDEPVSLALVDTGAGAITNFTVRGRSVLINKGGQLHWARLPALEPGQAPATAVSSHKLGCRAPGRISSSGRHIACVGTDEAGTLRVFAVAARGAVSIAVPDGANNAAPRTFAGERLLFTQGQNELWALTLDDARAAGAGARVAPIAPDQHVLGAPDGQRAVGWFSVTVKGEQVPALHVFRLDDRGVRRCLMKWAVPVDWSQDGQWLLVQRGARACLVRAVGGQYKCWPGFQALSISARGERLLLGRPVGPDGADDSAAKWSVKGYRGERGIVAVREQADGQAGDRAAGASAGHALRVYSVATDDVQPKRPAVVLSRVEGTARYFIAPAGQ